MMAKAAQKLDNDRAEKIAAVAYRINSLLHTMRAIQRHEDELCTIMTEIQNSGAVTPTLDEELRDLLEQMPAHEYLDDVDAVRNVLSADLLTVEQAAKPKGKTATPKGKTATRGKKA